jgi:hypothetical protein
VWQGQRSRRTGGFLFADMRAWLGMDAQTKPKSDLEAAHRHCIYHRVELERSSICGCFYCLSIFPPSDILEWIDDNQTALCPKCPVDAVIGSASGYPITREFLSQMHDKWF